MIVVRPWYKEIFAILAVLVFIALWLGGCDTKEMAEEKAATPAVPKPAPRMAEEKAAATAVAKPAPRMAEEKAAATAVPKPAPPTAATLASAPPPSLISAVDRILESMEWSNIALNTPLSMNLRDSAQIQLLLSMEQSIEDLSRTVTAAGEKEGARIRVSNRMEARVTGSNFQITAITSEEQAITSTGVTEW